MVDTPRTALPEISESQASKYATHNEALWILDALVQPSIIDKDLTAPPGGESDGDCYIPASVATGTWAGQENNIAQYQTSAYVFHAPEEGWKVYVKDENLLYYFNGTSWQKFVPPTDLFWFFAGVPGAAAIVCIIPVTQPLDFAINMPGGQGKLGTAATAQTDFDLQKNGVSIGTMRFAAAATVATFIVAAAQAFAAGDYLTVVAPNPADATAADLGFMLACTR